MNTDKGSEEQVIQEIRQLFVQQSLLGQGGGPTHWISAKLNSLSGSLAAILEKPSVVFITLSLSLLMLIVLSMRPSDNRVTETSANAMISAPETISVSNDVVEARLEDSSAEESLPPATLPEPASSFIVRAGAFRNPVNAQRVVQSLREHAIDAETKLLDSGLYVVILGPFGAKDVAEETARSVRKTAGLIPQVVSTQ